MTGAQLLALLAEQWQEPGRPRLLQPSRGLSYTWSPAGVVPGSVRINGAPLVPEQAYRLAVNSFLASGGDGFGTFPKARQLAGGPIDLDALVAWSKDQGTLRAGAPRLKMAP